MCCAAPGCCDISTMLTKGLVFAWTPRGVWKWLDQAAWTVGTWVAMGAGTGTRTGKGTERGMDRWMPKGEGQGQGHGGGGLGLFNRMDAGLGTGIGVRAWPETFPWVSRALTPIAIDGQRAGSISTPGGLRAGGGVVTRDQRVLLHIVDQILEGDWIAPCQGRNGQARTGPEGQGEGILGGGDQESPPKKIFPQEISLGLGGWPVTDAHWPPTEGH